jgi:hypothetical protein
VASYHVRSAHSKMRLRQVLVLSRDVARSTQFFQEGLGLKLVRSSDTFAEFDTRSGVPLCVKLAQKCVRLTVRVCMSSVPRLTICRSICVCSCGADCAVRPRAVAATRRSSTSISRT